MTANPFGALAGLRYGGMGFALAFVALPLYVVLPNYYANTFGVPLATLGLLLLGARLLDGLVDPLLGRWSDHLYALARTHALTVVLRWGGFAAVLLLLGFVGLFFPPVRSPQALLVWAALALTLTYLSYSALSILHQSWGAMLGGSEVQRSRLVAWREGLGLAGVLLASTASLRWGMQASSALFAAALVLAWWAWRSAPRPILLVSAAQVARASIWMPFSRPGFRALFSVFVVNGIASAIPATLILFFVQDRLQAAAHYEATFLGLYFASAALGIPLWLQCVKRIGLAKTWALGMLLSIGAFVFAARLGAGDIAAFMVVCALSGMALGTDLALPGAMLAGTIGDNGDRARAEGAYFGWWNLATKLNLALAAGVALPALSMLGYTPGAQDAAALRALTGVYCLLPCALKLVALLLLYFQMIRKSS